jgi:hypothetical protein
MLLSDKVGSGWTDFFVGNEQKVFTLDVRSG